MRLIDEEPVAPSPTESVPSPTSPTSAASLSPVPLAGTVVEVVDGDTIRVELPTGVETVRIIGIDTPEVVASERARGMLRRRSDGVCQRDARRQGRDPRARPDPGRARPVSTGSSPTSTSAARCTRPRPSPPATASTTSTRTEHPRRGTGRRRRRGARWRARHLGVVRGPGRPARGPGGRAAARRGARPRAARKRGLPPVLCAVRAERRPRPRLRRHRLPGRGHRPRRVPPRRQDNDGRGCESY